jgi:multidrug efflux pump subunit AcrA (membrane-fusion protein)
MAPVHQARLEVAKAQDEVSRRDLALKSAEHEVEVAKHEANVAKTQIDQTQAILNKANFDRNSQVGQQAQRDLATYKAQLDAAQAHQKAAQAAADLALAQKKQADAERELAETKLHLAEALALKSSGDPAGKNVNADSLRAQVDDRLKDVEKAKSDVTKLQTQAERERLAWQAATQRYNEVRGVGGSSTR